MLREDCTRGRDGPDAAASGRHQDREGRNQAASQRKGKVSRQLTRILQVYSNCRRTAGQRQPRARAGRRAGEMLLASSDRTRARPNQNPLPSPRICFQPIFRSTLSTSPAAAETGAQDCRSISTHSAQR